MGFWSTLAKVGGAIGGIVGAPFTGGASLAATGALLGSLGGGGKSKANENPTQVSGFNPTPYKQPDMDPQAKDLLGQAIQTSKTGDDTLKSGLDTLNQSKRYFQSAVGGNRDQLLDLLGPEVSTVLGQYDTAAKTASELSPRGAGRNAVLAETPFQKAQAVSALLPQARIAAAGKLADIGATEANIGSGLAGQKTGLVSQLLGVQQNQAQNALADRTLQQQLYQFEQALKQQNGQAKAQLLTDIGSSVGSLLVNIFKGKG